MLVRLKDVLKPDEIRQILAIMAEGQFESGAVTASGRARQVKNNLQFERKSEIKKRLDQIVIGGLMRHTEFAACAFPQMVAPPTFNRYDVGMYYGSHVDAPFLNNGQMRADLSLTVFLSDPASYDGGELTLDTGYGTIQAKEQAGDAVVYPTTSLHHVAPVTRGSRLAAVSWVQSYIADERERRILYELSRVKTFLERTASDAPETDLFRNVMFNLIRHWWRP
jgi:PKHD-type hydroxylase